MVYDFGMGTPLVQVEQGSAISDANLTPFAKELVTLSKEEYIRLVWEAKYWKAAHQQSSASVQRLEKKVAAALATIRDLQLRMFGRKSEQSSCADKTQTPDIKLPRPRGQQLGARGHGRNVQADLAVHNEIIGINSPQCPSCGKMFAEFPGTEDCEIVEIEVKAYKRCIHRRRYRKICRCSGVSGIITAPPPARLINRGKHGISVWVHIMLSKFSYGQPTHRLLRELSDLGLDLSAGAITGGLKAIAPLFRPLEESLLAKLRSETHWHADETRWMVFVEVEGKVGHRWILWVFQSQSAIHYVLDPTRSAEVPIRELSKVAKGGILSVDRYSAYKKFARMHSQFTLAFCWAHQRRDFFELANAHPDLSAWAFVWVARIGELYHLNSRRIAVQSDAAQYAACDRLLRNAVEQMAVCRDADLNDPLRDEPAVKVLQSMKNHWPGLTVFIDRPDIRMDNNTAERAMRHPVIGRKNYYGSGSLWSGAFAATMFSVLGTIKLWGINPRTWLNAYLHACAANGNKAPSDVNPFLPWAMDEQRLAMMKSAAPNHASPNGINTS